jgi:hypothetical protein
MSQKHATSQVDDKSPNLKRRIERFTRLASLANRPREQPIDGPKEKLKVHRLRTSPTTPQSATYGRKKHDRKENREHQQKQ